jgi:uncharacterized repeat protein (TIGR01451 family)
MTVNAAYRAARRGALLAIAVLPFVAAPAFAAPQWGIGVTHLNPYGQQGGVDPFTGSADAFDREGGSNQYAITVKNVGNEPVAENATVTVTDRLPQGLVLVAGEASLTEEVRASGWTCHIEEAATLVRCTKRASTVLEPLKPGKSCVQEPSGCYPPIDINGVYVQPQTQNTVEDSATVEGGGASPASATTSPKEGETKIETVPFGLHCFAIEALKETPPSRRECTTLGGTQETQAGGHPLALQTSLYFKAVVGEVGGAAERLTTAGAGLRENGPGPKEVEAELPPGLIGDVNNAKQCPLATFDREVCPAESAVGYAYVLTSGEYRLEGSQLPAIAPTGGSGHGHKATVYNLAPSDGHPAEFGLKVPFSEQPGGGVPVVLTAKVRSDRDYGVTTGSEASGSLLGAQITFCSYGVREVGTCEPPHPGARPFLSNPTQCSNAPVTTLMTNPWREPSDVVFDSFEMPLLTCENLSFDPSLEFTPAPPAEGGTTLADSPSGMTLELNNEASKTNNGPNPECTEETPGKVVCPPVTPALKNLHMTLPAGLTVSPAGADGLAACKNEEFGLETEFATPRYPMRPGLTPKEPAGEGHCPLASQIATVEVFTPLLTEQPKGTAPLKGALYAAAPECSPCSQQDAENGRIFRLFLQLQDKKAGVIVRLVGTSSINSAGRLETSFEDQPQTPFEKIILHLKGGPRASLATPQSCGPATTESILTPWSTPFTKNDNQASAFNVGGCEGRFSPSFTAGTEKPAAGQYSSFSLTVNRNDREANPEELLVQMPPGLTAKITGVTPCAEAQANAGTCGRESEIGTVSAGAGSGPHPLFEQGRAYLTGPLALYNKEGEHDPFGISIVIPAVAGPYNLGNVVTTSGIRIDPTTAAVGVISKGLPQTHDGIPLRLKTIHVSIDRRADFERNPTNCASQTLSMSIKATDGQTAAASSHFDVGGCGALSFNPAFSAQSEAKTSRSEGAALAVKIAQHEGEADIHRVNVQLPSALPSRLTTLQKACTQAKFASTSPPGQACSAESIVGSATAKTPLLPVPLTGPAILVARGAEFPDLEFLLRGDNVEIDVVGHTQIKNGVTYSKFETVPDQPIESFETVFPRGEHSILAANGNLCTQALAMPVTIEAQDGALQSQTKKISVSGCPNSRPLTNAQKLKRALKACRKKDKGHRRRRMRCERNAHRKYGNAAKAKRARASLRAGAASAAKAASGGSVSGSTLAIGGGAAPSTAPLPTPGEQGTCPNQARIAESNINPATSKPYAEALPECRAYEMVSPVEKQGQSALDPEELFEMGIPVSPNGQTAGFYSEGDFGEPSSWQFVVKDYLHPYLARRGPGAWNTSSAYAPASLIDAPESFALLGDLSADLEAAHASCGEGADGGYACARRVGQGSWSGAGPYLGIEGETVSRLGRVYKGGSADLSRVIVQPYEMTLLPTDLLHRNGFESTEPRGIYEISGLGSGSPHLQLVNVDGEGHELSEENEHAPVLGGAVLGVVASSYHAISESGERVFFTATPKGGKPTVFARLGGLETLALSAPEQCEPGEQRCKPEEARPARFWGASADGSKVFFTSEQELLPAQNDPTTNLYEYNFDASGHKLTRLSSGAPSGEHAEVLGLPSTSAHGEHVYFVARGRLTTVGNRLGQTAAAGADNLYSVDTASGAVKFVARLSTKDEPLWDGGFDSQGHLEPRGPEEEYLQDGHAQSTPDGRYMVFTTYARLAEADENGCSGVGVGNGQACTAQAAYRYDFNSEELTWLSHAAPGFATKEGRQARIAPLPVHLLGAYANIDDWNRGVSENGQDVIFTTDEQLQQSDGNKAPDVYLWHCAAPCEHPSEEGTVSMISDGQNPLGVDQTAFKASSWPAMSASGRDIFFFTSAQLVPQDTGELQEFYDARVEGGIAMPAAPASCAGEACQGAPSLLPEFSPQGSSIFTAGQNMVVPVASSAAAADKVLSTQKSAKPQKKTHSHKPRKKKRRRR